MGFRQKVEFFAPVWRVMRDSQMGVDEVGGPGKRGGDLGEKGGDLGKGVASGP